MNRFIVVTFVDEGGDVQRCKAYLEDKEILAIVKCKRVYQVIECPAGGNEFFERADGSLDSFTPDSLEFDVLLKLCKDLDFLGEVLKEKVIDRLSEMDADCKSDSSWRDLYGDARNDWENCNEIELVKQLESYQDNDEESELQDLIAEALASKAIQDMLE